MIPESTLRQIAEQSIWYESRALAAELLAARAERDRYHDALVARHGGEPVALLSELDAARAENERLAQQRDAFQSEMARAFGMASTLMEAIRDFDYYANHVDDALRAEAWAHVKAVVAGLKERGA